VATSNPHIVAITGASAGIGLATARELARRGDTVVLSARRADRLHDIAREITAAGGRALDLPGDVTSESDMTALVAKAVNTFGRLDVMICNAGIGYHGPLDETPPDAMRRLVDVNIMGTLYAARAAMIAMRRQGHGHIIAISSIVGRRGVGGSSVYAATKAAQLTFIESLRAEFVGSAFHASVVFPVRTETEFRDAIERDFGHVVGGVGPSQPAERVGRAIADCVGRPRAEVYPFGRSRLLAILGVIAPAQTDRLVQRFGRHRTPRPSTDDAGRA
jgi:NADP-dependent 3-hydroxy acid dehydrogenase YdfG